MTPSSPGLLRLHFEAPPPLWPAYVRALFSRKPALADLDQAILAIEARAPARVDAAHLAAYRAVCGCADDAYLPFAYPHVLAMPLHLAMLTSPAFPVRALGLVHVANRIERLREIESDATLILSCLLPGLRETGRGQECHIETEARVENELVWKERSTFLARRRAPADAKKHREAPASLELPAQRRTSTWEVPADIGRRYARASGDGNPIHLSRLTARLFGFPRAIAHGMWSLARVAAQLEAAPGARLAKLDVDFKLPVLLPASMHMHAWAGDGGHAVMLTDAGNTRPHLSGRYEHA